MRRRLRDGRDGRALVEELNRLGKQLSDPAERCRWFLELGVACESLVPERLTALALYQQAWEADAQHLEALSRARVLAAELGRLEDFVGIAEIELAREPDEARAEQLAVLIAEALLDLGDRQRATAFLVQAVAHFAASSAIQDALGTVGHDDDWHGEVERLIEIGEETEEAEVQARVFLRAARVLHMTSPDDTRYQTLLRRVLKCDPYNDSAHRLLEALLVQQARWDDLEALENALVAAFPGKDEQAFLCQRFAFNWCARGDDARAVAYSLRAIELGGFVFPIAGLTLLRGIYARRRQWNELLAAIDAVLATPIEDEAMVHAALLAGTIAWRALRDLERAAGYFERVRRIASDSILLIEFDDAIAELRNPETLSDEQAKLVETARGLGKSAPPERTIEAWKRAIACDPSRRAPRRGLARVLYQTERWRALMDALRDEEAYGSRDDAERVALLLQMATLYRERLHQDILAIQTLGRVLELQPGNLVALDRLEALQESLGRWAESAATLKRKLKHIEDRNERVQLQLRLAALYRERLGNESEALRELDAALTLEPSLDHVADELQEAFARRREWDKLIALKRRRLERVTGAAERLALLTEVALLASDKLKKPAEAIAAWQSVLAEAPAHSDALAALEKLFLVEKDVARLAEVVEKRAQLAEDPTVKAQHFLRLAGLYAEELQDPARAILAFRQVLELQPGNVRAQERLKRLYVSERRWGELEQLFAGLGRIGECVRLFERQAEESEGVTAATLWLRVGVLYRDALQQSGPAVSAFEKALKLDAQSAHAADALIDLYERAGDARRLASVLAIQLQHTDEPAARKMRLRRLARLHEEELDEPQAAFRWQLLLVENDAGDREARARLERLAERTAGWPQLVEVYQRAAPQLPAEERVQLLTVIAKQGAGGDGPLVLSTCQEILALDPANALALDALERFYSEARRYDELQDLYARKLALTSEQPARLDLLCKMAALAEAQGDDARASEAYRGVIAVAGDEPRTLAALDRILERTGDWRALKDVLVRERGLPSLSADERRQVGLRLARLKEQKLDEADGAVQLYQELLVEKPDHAEARASLERFLTVPGHELEAAKILEPVYRQLGDVERLIEVQEIWIARSTSSDEQFALLHTIAETYERERKRPDQAFEAMGRALRITPDDVVTLSELERLADLTSSWQPLADLYREIAKRSLSVDQHVEIRCRLAWLYRDKLKDAERAIATYSRVLDLKMEMKEAQRALDELLSAQGRFAELAERLRSELARGPEPERARACRLRLAEILALKLDDAPGAIDCYREVLDQGPDTREAIDGLQRLFDEGRSSAQAARLLEKRYRAVGDLVGLFGLLVRKLAEAPWVEGVRELEALARETGGEERFVAALREVIASASGEVAIEARLGLARMSEARGDDADAAAEYGAALQLKADQLDALVGLEQLFARGGRHADRAELLRRRLSTGAGDRLELALTLADLEEHQLASPERAKEAYREALVAAPDEPRALRGLARLEDGAVAETLWGRLLALAPDDEEALAALSALHERNEDWAKLAAVLQRQVKVVAGSELEPALLEQLALVSSRLGDTEGAISSWRRAAQVAPDPTTALRELARRLRDGQRTAELAEVLARLVEQPSLGAEKTVALCAELAELEANALGRIDRAIAAWERVLAVDAGHDQALAALGLLYAQTGRSEEEIALVEKRASARLAAGEREQATALWAQAAAAWEQAGNSERAALNYDRILGVDPAQATACAQLEAFYRARGEWLKLAALFDRRLGASVGAHERAELLRERAALEEGPLADPRAALKSLLSAFALDGRWPVFADELRRLARATGQAQALVSALREQAERAGADPAQKMELLLELGEQHEQLGNEAAALEAYRSAAKLDGEATQPLERLERILQRSGSAELLDVLAKRAQLSLDHDERLRLLSEVARSAAQLGRWVRAVATHQQCAELESSAVKRGEHLLRAGLIYRDELASFDEAFSCFDRALEGFAEAGLDPPVELTDAHRALQVRNRSRAQR